VIRASREGKGYFMGGFKSRKIGVKSNGQDTVAVGPVHDERRKAVSSDEPALAAMLLTATPRCAAP
jgi:hypothetical protein